MFHIRTLYDGNGHTTDCNVDAVTSRAGDDSLFPYRKSSYSLPCIIITSVCYIKTKTEKERHGGEEERTEADWHVSV